MQVIESVFYNFSYLVAIKVLQHFAYYLNLLVCC